jgi:hypothetical protein
VANSIVLLSFNSLGKSKKSTSTLPTTLVRPISDFPLVLFQRRQIRQLPAVALEFAQKKTLPLNLARNVCTTQLHSTPRLILNYGCRAAGKLSLSMRLLHSSYLAPLLRPPTQFFFNPEFLAHIVEHYIRNLFTCFTIAADSPT